MCKPGNHNAKQITAATPAELNPNDDWNLRLKMLHQDDLSKYQDLIKEQLETFQQERLEEIGDAISALQEKAHQLEEHLN